MTEDLIPDRAIYERFWEHPVQCSEMEGEILRWQGLSPATYRLEYVPNLYAMRIVRKATP